MKKFTLFLLLLLCSIIVFGKPTQDTTKHLRTTSTATPIQVSITLPETLQVGNISDKKESNTHFVTILPWIIALLIGVFSAVVNFRIAKSLRKSNEKNLQFQIDSNERNVKSQIESNERSLQKQIEITKETTLIEFKATIATKNRQEWINELRETLSVFLTSSIFVSPNISRDLKIKFTDGFVEKALFARAKIELLTNKDKPEQKELLDNVNIYYEIVLKQLKGEAIESSQIVEARSSISQSARKLFKIHWNKIKELQ